MRLPKEIYFAHRVMQSEQPDLHILGHWSYPRAGAQKTVKTVYVIANYRVGGAVRQRQVAWRELEAGEWL